MIRPKLDSKITFMGKNAAMRLMLAKAENAQNRPRTVWRVLGYLKALKSSLRWA